MGKLKEDRSFLVYLLLTFLTCGIYGFYFMWRLIRDINTACAPKERDSLDRSPNWLIVSLLTTVTCGIYYYIWLYKQGNRMKRIGQSYGIQIDETGTALVVWTIFGSLLCGVGPFVAVYLMINTVNKLCIGYNREFENFYFEEEPVIPQNKAAILPPPVFLQQNYDAPINSTCQIHFTRGVLEGQSITLNDGEQIIIGRDSNNCQLIIPDQNISRHHCDIQYDAAQNCCYIWDYSSYGVYVNGNRIPKQKTFECKIGSKISLSGGKNEFVLR